MNALSSTLVDLCQCKVFIPTDVLFVLSLVLLLVNACPMFNGDLRRVGMTLYKGSTLNVAPGAAKVTEDNCVWHPAPPAAAPAALARAGAAQQQPSQVLNSTEVKNGQVYAASVYN